MSMELRKDDNWRFTITKNGVVYRENFKGSEKQAIKAHQIFKVDVDRGEFGTNENMKFITLAQLVLDEYVRKNLKYNTEYMYKCYYNKHIIPEFGNKKISAITTLDIQKFANKLSAKYKPRMVTHNLNIIRSTFKKAVEWGLLKESPYKFISKPKSKNTSHSEILTLKEIKKLLTVYENLPICKHKVAFFIAIGCGLRNSEIRALTTDDIDFKNNTIKVVKQDGLYYEDNELKFGNIDLKTDQSKRTVYTPDFVIKVIKDYLNILPYKSISKQLFYNPTTNRPVDRHTFSKGLSRILKKNNLTTIRFHDLRHIHATLLINSNVNIQSVSKRLGHSTIQTTLNSYVHSIDSIDKEVASNLDNIINGITSNKQSTLNLPQLKI